MGTVRPKTRLFIAFSSLFLSGFYLVASDWTEEEWNPSLDLPSSEASVFDDDLSLNDDYHFPAQKEDPFHIFNIAEELPKEKPSTPEPAREQNSSAIPETESKAPALLQPTGAALPELQPTPDLPATTPPSPLLTPGATEALLNPNRAVPETIVIPAGGVQDNSKGILINFSNVSIVEFIRFISRASNRNFIFDESNLQFNVSIVSEEPTSLPNIMTALMQVLRVHGLSLMEQGNNILIHNNKAISQVSTVVSDSLPQTAQSKNAELITRVFRLNTLDPEKAAVIIAPLVSEGALVEVLKDTSHLIVTDLSTNVAKIGQLIKSLDAPNSGLVMGQYVVNNALVDSLIDLGQKVMSPIAEGKPLVFVAHQPSNSIFIVSTPFLVDRTLAVLRTLDINVGQTRIFGQDSLEFDREAEAQRQNANRTQQEIEAERLRAQSEEAARSFVQNNGGIGGPGANAGGPGGAKNSSGTLESSSPWSAGLPAGHIERTKFFIHKLRYRKGEQIVDALGRIGLSLQETGSGNLDLISTIQSIQWLEGSNSLVFTGTNISLQKVRELIDEIDTPLRQVFIEMLILETTLDDSLEFGVNFASRFRGGNTAGAQSFLSHANTLTNALDFPIVNTASVINNLDASALARDLGYHLGIIGKNITHCGVEFGTVGALVKAIHDKNKTEILMNPRLLVEDNATAEIFVGINTPFKTQSIANDQGSIITNNVEFRDVGTRLKVTPLISNNDIITLDILEEVSSIADTATLTGALTNQDLGPSTRTSKTTTRVHVPNKFFLVMSGMIQNQESRTRSQVPCLGGAPLIGSLFSEKRMTEQKRNLMIFIRPQIIDTDEDIDDLTRHQQDIYRNTGRSKKMWKYEVEEALDLLNVKEPDVSLHDSEVYNP